MINIEAKARGSETQMIDIQKVLVADRIQRLERDTTPQAGRRRAPRGFARDAGAHGSAPVHPSVRLRLGRWVVAVGEAIAGPTVASVHEAPKSIPRAA